MKKGIAITLIFAFFVAGWFCSWYMWYPIIYRIAQYDYAMGNKKFIIMEGVKLKVEGLAPLPKEEIK